MTTLPRFWQRRGTLPFYASIIVTMISPPDDPAKASFNFGVSQNEAEQAGTLGAASSS